ncbi:MAG TPA: rhodanese-like domain-containing protein [Thermoanaerobaculia bacterium]|nr:rhodanese-like domain-containing protein [Thermoanaerobaculia bacterium]
MSSRNPILQGVVIIVAALCIAVIANGFSSRQRKLVLPGKYMNALKVPPREPLTVPPPPRTETAVDATAPVTATTATAPSISPTTSAAPIAAPIATTTIAQPTTTTTHPSTTTPAAATTTQKIAEPKPATAAAAPAVNEDPQKRFPPHPDKAYVEISGDDAAWLYSKGVMFIDARRSSVFEQGHITGARSFSVWESDVDDKVNALFNERSDPREQNLPIVVYCSGGACEDSHMLAQKLWGVQFNNVYVYKDGFPDWQKRGGAVKTGGQP